MIEIGCPGSVQSIVRENIRRENSNLKDDKRGPEILALIIAKEADSLFFFSFLFLLLTPFLPCFFSSSFVCSFCVLLFKQNRVQRKTSNSSWELVSTPNLMLFGAMNSYRRALPCLAFNLSGLSGLV